MNRPEITVDLSQVRSVFEQAMSSIILLQKKYIDHLESRSKPSGELREEVRVTLESICIAFVESPAFDSNKATDKILSLITPSNIVFPTDERIDLIKCEEAQQDWNDLAYKKSFEDGFDNAIEFIITEIKKLNKIY